MYKRQDYQEVLGRLHNEAMIGKFVRMFLQDDSFQILEAALRRGDVKAVYKRQDAEAVGGNIATGKQHPYLKASDWGWQIDPIGLRYTCLLYTSP